MKTIYVIQSWYYRWEDEMYTDYAEEAHQELSVLNKNAPKIRHRIIKRTIERYDDGSPAI